MPPKGRIRGALTWAVLAAVLLVPLVIAAGSPLLAWRHPVYIIAGFAGIVGMGCLLLQPLLIGGYLPGLSPFRARKVHRWIGAGLLGAVLVHVIGLWIASPPDMIDALTFTSPTLFTPFGVIAMWAVFASAMLALLRRRFSPRVWRRAHTVLAALIVTGSIVHAVLIEGTMGWVSKLALCACVAVVTIRVVGPRLKQFAGGRA